MIPLPIALVAFALRYAFTVQAASHHRSGQDIVVSLEELSYGDEAREGTSDSHFDSEFRPYYLSPQAEYDDDLMSMTSEFGDFEIDAQDPVEETQAPMAAAVQGNEAVAHNRWYRNQDVPLDHFQRDQARIAARARLRHRQRMVLRMDPDEAGRLSALRPVIRGNHRRLPDAVRQDFSRILEYAERVGGRRYSRASLLQRILREDPETQQIVLNYWASRERDHE